MLLNNIHTEGNVFSSLTFYSPDASKKGGPYLNTFSTDEKIDIFIFKKS